MNSRIQEPQLTHRGEVIVKFYNKNAETPGGTGGYRRIPYIRQGMFAQRLPLREGCLMRLRLSNFVIY
jgi:hypothetical protein